VASRDSRYRARLLQAWIDTANAIATGGKLYCGYPEKRHYCGPGSSGSLHDSHKRFTAGRSMRDAEHSTPLRIVDPNGNVLLTESSRGR
jgi:hypothetical protein